MNNYHDVTEQISKNRSYALYDREPLILKLRRKLDNLQGTLITPAVLALPVGAVAAVTGSEYAGVAAIAAIGVFGANTILTLSVMNLEDSRQQHEWIKLEEKILGTLSNTKDAVANVFKRSEHATDSDNSKLFKTLDNQNEKNSFAEKVKRSNTNDFKPN